MTLMGIVGEMGAGKTLSAVYFALRAYWKQRPIFSNIKLIKLPYTPVTTTDQVEGMKEGFFLGDELWLWADSRMSASHKNKFATMILAKSRKRDLDIVYTVQSFRQIDVRIRNVTDFLAVPSLNESETICRCPVYTNPSGVLQRVYKFRTDVIFGLYDTREEVQALDFEGEAKKIAVERAVKKIMNKEAEKNAKEKTITYEED